MHRAEFLLGIVLIGFEYLPGMIVLAVLLGIAAAILLGGGKESDEEDDEG